METVAGSSGSAGLAGVFPDVLVWSSPEADFRNQELAVEVKNTPLPAQTSSLDEQVAEVKHAEPFQKEPVALLANVSSKKSAGEVPEEIVEVAPASVALAEQEAPIESVKKKRL